MGEPCSDCCYHCARCWGTVCCCRCCPDSDNEGPARCCSCLLLTLVSCICPPVSTYWVEGHAMWKVYVAIVLTVLLWIPGVIWSLFWVIINWCGCCGNSKSKIILDRTTYPNITSL